MAIANPSRGQSLPRLCAKACETGPRQLSGHYTHSVCLSVQMTESFKNYRRRIETFYFLGVNSTDNAVAAIHDGAKICGARRFNI